MLLLQGKDPITFLSFKFVSFPALSASMKGAYQLLRNSEIHVTFLIQLFALIVLFIIVLSRVLLNFYTVFISSALSNTVERLTGCWGYFRATQTI